MKLRFDPRDHEFAASLSAAVRVGHDFWLGGDEGIKLLAFRATAGSESMVKADEVDLHDAFDLPGNAKHEVDLEGMDWDGTADYSWDLAAVHDELVRMSLGRDAAKNSR